MAEAELPPGERGSISRLIDAVEALTDRLSASPAPVALPASPVNWWDVLPPDAKGENFGSLFLPPVDFGYGPHGPRGHLEIRCFIDKLELSLFGPGGVVWWRRCLYFADAHRPYQGL